MKRSAADISHVILGAGGHARSLLGLLAACDLRLGGCIAPAAPEVGWPASCPWLGNDAALGRLDIARAALVNGLGSVGPTALRRQVFDTARKRGFTFPTLVHPSAIVAEHVALFEGAQVLAGAILQAGVTVEENVLLNTGCIVDHGCWIGAHTHLAPGVTLSGSVTIGSGVHVGTGAVILQGVRIGDLAIVGAGAVVTRDVTPGATVVGNPARSLARP
ncbi:acetyltransferase (plasmid) [Sulfitobacter faviae]|uniref:Acetyltransferase n=1 Tax=Sulfitobacter faviae TaxID=1775881 RepID=A0ABZ0V945_9RHOB|nr:acetyltransferase [Sulfitobacter faviae]WPZ23582.1 acetyltransferase [Sulfitobacter faviae]